MYGDTDYGKPESTVSSYGRPVMDGGMAQRPDEPLSSRRDSSTVTSPARPASMANGLSGPSSRRSSASGYEHGSTSPTASLRDRPPSIAANTAFPLSNVDYESSPAAVAQEMVNLQALRRMSMVDSATSDPDLPSFNSPIMPTIAPTSADDEEDASRLFWVPARLHPELAPKEFKTFLEKRVDQIKRRSGDDSTLGTGLQASGSAGGLRRKKSMLSRQIDNAGGRGGDGYEDGAERLERKRSQSPRVKQPLRVADLQELDALAQDPSNLMRKLSLDTERRAVQGVGEVPASEDMPILPAAPPGQSLRRSTRTTYRRGSLRKGERVPPSKRAVRAAETDSDESAVSSPVVHGTEMPLLGLTRVHTEPIPSADESTENFSRPSRRGLAATPGSSTTASFDDMLHDQSTTGSITPTGKASTSFAQRVAADRGMKSSARPRSPTVAGGASAVPRIVETPPPEDDGLSIDPSTPTLAYIPERRSSHEPPPPLAPQVPLPQAPTSKGRPLKRPSVSRPARGVADAGHTLHDIVGQPSPLPGSSTRTDSLSFIPTYNEERRPDKKGKDKRDKNSGDGAAPRKSSWGWLLGTEEKEKEIVKKGKGKPPKVPDKTHDNARLDLLQTSIDGSRGRESLVLERESTRLEEERRKESGRRSTEPKKERDTGLFSSFFGSKKKGERDSSSKKDRQSRGLSPDPGHRHLRPDVDYHWTRFPIAEERAIYRMAHMKLANPRRALHSQVLLSNFMYAYLAKVQQMHPSAQVVQPPTQHQQQHQQHMQLQLQQGQQSPQPVDLHQHQQDQYYQYQHVKFMRYCILA